MSTARPMDRSLSRMLALACDRALSGLTPEEEVELVSLLPPGARMDASLERAAAAVMLSELTIDEPLPRHVADRLYASARAARSSAAPMMRGGTVPMPGRQSVEVPTTHRVAEPIASEPGRSKGAAVVNLDAKRRKSSALPWLAAAACFALAVGSFVYFGLGVPPGKTPVASGTVERPEPSAAERKSILLAEAKDVVRTAWTSTADPDGQGETGEVVWSNARQEGYMTFRAVKPNDPSKSQYQLWIFDADQDEKYPVDGGVFDIASNGEVVIPITAKIRVAKPTLFAVTVEKPGGVVVSKRERIVVAAKVAG